MTTKTTKVTVPGIGTWVFDAEARTARATSPRAADAVNSHVPDYDRRRAALHLRKDIADAAEGQVWEFLDQHGIPVY